MIYFFLFSSVVILFEMTYAFFDISQDVINIHKINTCPIRYVMHKEKDDEYVIIVTGPYNNNVQLMEKRKIGIMWANYRVGKALNVNSIFRVHSTLSHAEIFRNPKLQAVLPHIPPQGLPIVITLSDPSRLSKQFWEAELVRHKIKNGDYLFYEVPRSEVNRTVVRRVLDMRSSQYVLGKYTVYAFLFDSNKNLKDLTVRQLHVRNTGLLHYIHNVYKDRLGLYVIITLALCIFLPRVTHVLLTRLINFIRDRAVRNVHTKND